MKANGVDFVHWDGCHPELGQILHQGRGNGVKARFMAGEACANDPLSQIAQDASEGLLVTVPRAFDADPENKAVEAAGSEDPERVAKAVHEGTFKTPTGTLSFDGKGDLKDFRFMVHEWHFGRPKTEVSPQ
ncbi:hypothetical protein ACIGG5_27540 [Streptomyces sp. NPDC085463]|uniref:hypothetical protein n=1 Tax=unclassified Streptomyces TaxID=2593676 RepID=UPI0036E5D7E9